MSLPLVSILIPTHSGGRLIAEVIESAINQTYKNIESIVVENSSPDRTWEMLKNYSQEEKGIEVYRDGENIGPVRNWKRCLEYVQDEYAKRMLLS